jgi:transposase InsO family protein
LDRGFTAAAPNQVWTADMTCIWCDEGWLYLAVVLDLFNREVVGWSIKPSESFFNSLKNERVHGTRSFTRAEAIGGMMP